MLMVERAAKLKLERQNKLNQRLDEIRALDDTVAENNQITEKGRRLILLSLQLHMVIIYGVCTKDFTCAKFIIRTCSRLIALKQMEDMGCYEMFNEMEGR